MLDLSPDLSMEELEYFLDAMSFTMHQSHPTKQTGGKIKLPILEIKPQPRQAKEHN